MNWEVSNPKLFATLLYHSFQEIIVNSDGTFENINTAIWKEAESGKFYFHCVRDMHSFENYDTLEDAFEALKANFVIKEI